MDVRLDATPWTTVDTDWLVVGVLEKTEPGATWRELDAALGGQLTRLRESQDVTGKAGETVALRDVPGITAKRLLLIGLGDPGKLDLVAVERGVLTAARSITTKAGQRIAFVVPTAPGQPVSAEWVTATSAALQVAGQGQDLYRTEKSRHPLASIHLLVEAGTDLPALQQAAERGTILGEAVNLARTLVNEPPAAIYPLSFAQKAAELASSSGLQYQLLDEATLRQERMGSLLAVAQGSTQPPCIVRLEHRGSETGPTLTLCGKGVTFDSGGLSLKTNDGMLTMKCDMAGAATVLAAMTAIARLKLPVRVVGLMGLVENMPSGTSFKLGDVLKARNGVTIEVHNTDAEGRLVLADVLSYAVDTGADYLVDLATLTGACVVALGEDVSGAFTNNQDWCNQLLSAAKRTGEDVWQMPMFDHYAELIKSDVADIKNVGGRWGGAITAAKFLERFVGGKPWVHLDIAGPAFASGTKPQREGGATGCLVRTLIELARQFPTG